MSLRTVAWSSSVAPTRQCRGWITAPEAPRRQSTELGPSAAREPLPPVRMQMQCAWSYIDNLRGHRRSRLCAAEPSTGLPKREEEQRIVWLSREGVVLPLDDLGVAVVASRHSTQCRWIRSEAANASSSHRSTSPLGINFMEDFDRMVGETGLSSCRARLQPVHWLSP